MMTSGGGSRVSPATLERERLLGTRRGLVIWTTAAYDAHRVARPYETARDHAGVEAAQPQLLADLAVDEEHRLLAEPGDELRAAVVGLRRDLEHRTARVRISERQP